MKIQCGNIEPDGRLLIETKAGYSILEIDPTVIDIFADNLKQYCGSESDGYPFEIDLATGKITML